MLSLLYLFKTFSRAFGDAPRLFLSVLNYYRMSNFVANIPSRGTCKLGEKPDPELLAAHP